MSTQGTRDPQWDLVIEIAAKLWIDGECAIELDPLPTQRLVDLQWAARQAGRVLGGRASVRVRGVTVSRGSTDRRVAVLVTYVDSTDRGLLRAEEGLEALMRQVIEAQPRG
jgi:hypothetical protein